MIQGNIETGKHQDQIEKAINFVINRGFDEVKARHEDYEEPGILRMKNSDVELIPDITASKNGGKYYFEIADRNDKPEKVVGKWKLMSTLARMKNGDFRIFVPYGSMKYTTDIIQKKNIEAGIIKLPR